MIVDDGKHRVELWHFGVAHTHGDGFAWLPKEEIQCTRDPCVTGPYNCIGDGDSEQWIKTLENAKKLSPKTVCPGHGPIGTGALLEEQQQFFVELRKGVKKYARKTPKEVQSSLEVIKEPLAKQHSIARYLGDFFPAQVEKVYVEMGGKPFLPKEAAMEDHVQHAHAHGNLTRTH